MYSLQCFTFSWFALFSHHSTIDEACPVTTENNDVHGGYLLARNQNPNKSLDSFGGPEYYFSNDQLLKQATYLAGVSLPRVRRTPLTIPLLSAHSSQWSTVATYFAEYVEVGDGVVVAFSFPPGFSRGIEEQGVVDLPQFVFSLTRALCHAPLLQGVNYFGFQHPHHHLAVDARSDGHTIPGDIVPQEAEPGPLHKPA